MELREALTILGEDRVRRGMRAITDRRDVGPCASCFVGEAFGGTYDGYARAVRDESIACAARTCEAWFEEYSVRPGCGFLGVGYPTNEELHPRAVLLRACQDYLRECEMIRAAEHGQAVEPNPLEAICASR